MMSASSKRISSGIASASRLGRLRRRDGELKISRRPRRGRSDRRARGPPSATCPSLISAFRRLREKRAVAARQEGVEPLARRLGLDPEGALLYGIAHDALRRRRRRAARSGGRSGCARKLVRLLFVSGGIMMLGLIAVFAAIVYKLGMLARRRGRPEPAFRPASPVEGTHRHPGRRRASSRPTLDGDRALLTLAAPDGSTSLLLVDLATGATLGRYAVAPGNSRHARPSRDLRLARRCQRLYARARAAPFV